MAPSGGKSVTLRGTSAVTVFPTAVFIPAHTRIHGHSVEAEWVTAEKPRENPRQYQRQHHRKGAAEIKQPTLRVFSSDDSSEEDEGARPDSRPEMDDAPCLLYIHGGKTLLRHAS